MVSKVFSVAKIVFFMIQLTDVSNSYATCISHNTDQAFDLSEKETQLKSTVNLSLPLEEELTLLKQLTEFDLGRYLLEKKV